MGFDGSRHGESIPGDEVASGGIASLAVFMRPRELLEKEREQIDVHCERESQGGERRNIERT